MKKNFKKSSRGITLIALVITIIVLLILAGISIVSLIGENGIIKKATNASEQYKQEAAREKLSLAIINLDIKKLHEQGRQLLLEELSEIKEDGIAIQLTVDGEVEVFTDEEKGEKYAIAIVDGYKFKVYENLRIELMEENGEESKEGYIQDGLIVLYDGKNNTGNGHSNDTTTWKNLAPISEYNIEGKNDGILKNINQTAASGWTENSLILDGVDDWVAMSYLHFENMTIEIVAKPLDVDMTKTQRFLANVQNGGIGIQKTPQNNIASMNYIDGSYRGALSENDIKIGQIYSLSAGYNGINAYISENNKKYQTEITGTFTAPEDQTIFVIGTNPSGKEEALISTDARSNIEVFSVRIYNRCLTDKEIKHNYELDKKRFNIQEEKPQEDIGYVSNGLVCLYDGKQNTPYGHSKKSPVWGDLSGNGQNGTLMNINHSKTSGWTENSLIIDGVNDWVAMPYINHQNMTIEIVAKPLTINTSKVQHFITNLQYGGLGIRKSAQNYIQNQLYAGGTYKYVTSEKMIEVGKIYSLSAGYNESTMYLSENNKKYQTAETGAKTAPENKTIYAIGTNPSGTSEVLTTTEVRSNMEVFSVRIYNRCLTDEEIKHNYEIDKARFQIQ